MDKVQNEVNRLAAMLRIQVIEVLVKEDRIKYGAKPLSGEEMQIVIGMIARLKCNTKLLRRLFNDAHDMHEEKGMMPHAATVGDLEWCIKYRCIGYSNIQRTRNAWLVAKEDEDLRRLPAFVELTRIYRPMHAAGKKILPPVEKKAIESEAMAIINEVATSMKEA